MGNPVGRMPQLLYLSCDPDSLSPYQVLLHRQIELVEALERDVCLMQKSVSATPGTLQGRNKPIVLGQVGIRCMRCFTSDDLQNRRSRGVVYYPSSLVGIYQAAQNMASAHFLSGACKAIPAPLQREMQSLRGSSKSQTAVGSGKLEWARRASLFGVYQEELKDVGSSILRFYPLSDRSPLGLWCTKEPDSPVLDRAIVCQGSLKRQRLRRQSFGYGVRCRLVLFNRRWA